MPWKATDAMKERTKLVLESKRRWNQRVGGPVNMAEPARMFGVSRQSAYTWVKRYREASRQLDALKERSRRLRSLRPW